MTGWRFAALNLDEVCDPTENSLADEFVKFNFTGSNVGNCFTSGQARGQVRTPHGYQFVADPGLESACLKVFLTLENIGQNSLTIEPATWEALLILLLGVTDLLLSPPGPGGHLCHSAASVLCHSWMSACSKNFPSPSLWKTFQSLATGWRHRIEMISHWSTVNLALLSKQLQFLYDPQFPRLQVDSCCSGLEVSMTNEVVAQVTSRTWRRQQQIRDSE